MLKTTLCLAALACCLSVSQAASRIPLRTVPADIKAAIQRYVPGARLTLAKIRTDAFYGPIYQCYYTRPGRQGFIAVSSLALLVDVSEPLSIRNLSPSIRYTIWRETKGGEIKHLALNCQSGREVYQVKANYSRGTNREVYLLISRENRVLSRNVSVRGLFTWL